MSGALTDGTTCTVDDPPGWLTFRRGAEVWSWRLMPDHEVPLTDGGVPRSLGGLDREVAREMAARWALIDRDHAIIEAKHAAREAEDRRRYRRLMHMFVAGAVLMALGLFLVVLR